MTQDVVEPLTGRPWAFSLGDWKLHITMRRQPNGGAGIDVCTVPSVYAADPAAAHRAMSELMHLVHGLIHRAGGKLPATDQGVAYLLPHIRTWVEDAARRGVVTWTPDRIELFLCQCAAGRCSHAPAPETALAADQDFPRDCPPGDA